MDALEEFSGSNDKSIIIKGKRTKRRQRPLSPVGRAAAAVTSSSSSDGGEVLGHIYSSNPSSTTSTNEISGSTSTHDQEDEDMAKCLILLARGESCRKQVDQDEIKMEKFSSRRFNDMVSSTRGGKVGIFVYECKTCNKTFPSFQALGGHRTSHKKPKVTTGEIKKANINVVTSSNDIDHHHHEEEEEEEEEGENEEQAGQLNSQSMKKLLLTNNIINKAKVHECAICGAEFSSGQALGGHMRRHRNAMTSTKVPMILETTPSHDHVQKPSNIIFPLDLNLPAPSEEDLHRDLKFQFSGNQQQQQNLVFSAPALVDCHY